MTVAAPCREKRFAALSRFSRLYEKPKYMAKQRVTGKCKLCRSVKQLRDSHYMPKRLYAFLRANKLKNPNPVMSVDGELKQVSDQYRDYVFCEGCEDLFNKNGEKWVLANIPHDYGDPFPLHDAIKPLAPIQVAQGINVYNVSAVGGFSAEKLIYFGLSVFWRGAAHRWKSSAGRVAPEVFLGDCQEPMRTFLLGEGPFPTDVVLMLDIWPYEKVLQTIYPVLAQQLRECQGYWFYVPGLVFFLFVGTNIPQGVRDANLSSGIVSLDSQVADSILDLTREGAKSERMGPKIPDMLREISVIRSPKESK